jgi:hypothetical protein
MPAGLSPTHLPALLVLLGALPRAGLAQTTERSLDPDRHPDFGIAVRFGTLGIGLEANKLITGHLGARVGANYFKHSTTKTQTDITYDATLKLKAFTALLDFFPARRGAFHLTGGIITNPAKVVATGKPTAAGEFKINGNSYTTAEVGTLRGVGKFPSVSPYVGLGWGTAARKGSHLGFLFDLGAALGKATVSLTSSGAASNPALASDLKAQERKTQHDIEDYTKVYPVLAFGLTYRL